MPKYFIGVWPDQKDLYGGLNAGVVSVCGFASAIGGGYLTDYFEIKGNYMSKAYGCMIGTALGIPTIALCVLSNTPATED